MVFPVIPAWPSVPNSSAASEWRCFPVGILGSCNTKMLLKGYWSSKFCRFLSAMLPHQSLIIVFQFHVLPLGIITFPWCSLICPRLLSVGYLSHLDLPISLLPQWSQVRGRGSCTALPYWPSLGCLCASEELGRVWCSWFRAKAWILRAFGPFHDEEPQLLTAVARILFNALMGLQRCRTPTHALVSVSHSMIWTQRSIKLPGFTLEKKHKGQPSGGGNWGKEARKWLNAPFPKLGVIICWFQGDFY